MAVQAREWPAAGIFFASPVKMRLRMHEIQFIQSGVIFPSVHFLRLRKQTKTAFPRKKLLTALLFQHFWVYFQSAHMRHPYEHPFTKPCSNAQAQRMHSLSTIWFYLYRPQSKKGPFKTNGQKQCPFLKLPEGQGSRWTGVFFSLFWYSYFLPAVRRGENRDGWSGLKFPRWTLFPYACTRETRRAK